MDIGELRFSRRFERFHEIRVTLRRVTDDYVGGYRRGREKFADKFALRKVFAHGVMTVHRFENVVRAGLQRKVEMRSKVFQFFKRRKKILRYHVRLQRAEPYSAINARKSVYKFFKPQIIVVIRRKIYPRYNRFERR